MLKNLYLMSGTDAFTKGGLDNVALTENAVCLEQSGGRYVLYGCFTSPEIRFPAFRQLTVSWNAETPKGTVVELSLIHISEPTRRGLLSRMPSSA